MLGLVVTALVGVTGLLFSILYFAANAQVSLCALSVDPKVFLEFTGRAASKGCALGALAAFEEISYDLSSVTPLLLSLFFGWLLVSSVRSLSGLESRASLHQRYGTLPFPRSYEATWVQLGLIGTIWGFILIGWNLRSIERDAVSDVILQILLNAFGTALLSTFTGVVLAFVAAPPVIAWWNWLHDLEDPDPDLNVAVGRLTRQMSALGDRSNELSEKLRETQDDVKTVTSELAGAISSLAEGIASVEEAVRSLKLELPLGKIAEIQQTWASIKESAQRLETHAMSTAKNVADLAKPISDVRSSVDGVKSSVDQVNSETNRVGNLVTATFEKAGELATPIETIKSSVGEMKEYTRRSTDTADKTVKIVSDLKGQIDEIARDSRKAAKTLDRIQSVVTSRTASLIDSGKPASSRETELHPKAKRHAFWYWLIGRAR